MTNPDGERGSTTLKRFSRGTHRATTPEQTFNRVRGMFGPMGITRVANVTGLDCIGIPVVAVCRPNARSLAISQGKGMDIASARASGVMEAIELYHAERVILPLLLATWNEMRFSHPVVDVNRLPRTCESQFHPERSLLWVEAKQLADARATWVPFELVHTNFSLPLATGSGCFVMSSNGLASGNSLSEAIAHGLCEVIERDAATLFLCRPEAEQLRLLVDPRTVDDVDCRRLLELFDRAGIAVGIWDMTSDVGIPAFRCVVIERNPSMFRITGPIKGMGCHPTREIALQRALTEAAQGRLTLIAGARDDNGRAQYADARDPARTQVALDQLNRAGTHSFQEVKTVFHESVDEDIQFMLQRLQEVGLGQVLVVDLSKREFGVPVARVIVPGLEPHHHHRGSLPGPRAREVLARRQVQT